jgi:fibronectin-binding autotransporter adhesin
MLRVPPLSAVASAASSRVAALFVLSAFVPGVASAQYIWKPTGTATQGQWTAPARWTDGPDGTYPNSPDATATFNIPLSNEGTGNYNVQISNTAGTSVTVGSVTVNYDDITTSNTRFGANGNGTITLQSSTGTATWTENKGAVDTSANTIVFAPVIFGSNTVITQNHNVQGNAGLQFSSSNNSPGGITAAPEITLTKEGAGNVEFTVAPEGPDSGFQGALVVNKGGVRLEANVFQNARELTVNSGGQLQLAGGGAVASWSLAPGATLSLSGSGKSVGANPEGALRYQHYNSTATFSNPVNLADDSTVFINAAINPEDLEASTFGHLSLTAEVSGDGGLTKSGYGILELTHGNSYAGGTTVNQGILLVNNASDSATGTGNVVVNPNSVLAGSGSIAGDVSLVDAILSPGNSAGTLTLGSTAISAGSQLLFELDTPNVVGGVNDLVVVNGDLLLAGTIVVNPLAGFGAGSYRLFDYSGLFSSGDLTIAGVPSQFVASLDLSVPGQVNLSVAAVPEPSTWVLLAGGAGAFGLIARRRRAARANG